MAAFGPPANVRSDHAAVERGSVPSGKGADCKSAASWLRRFESCLPHQPSLACASFGWASQPQQPQREANEGCHAVAHRAQAGFITRSYSIMSFTIGTTLLP